MAAFESHSPHCSRRSQGTANRAPGSHAGSGAFDASTKTRIKMLLLTQMIRYPGRVSCKVTGEMMALPTPHVPNL
jgi:hypothetical protein